MKIDENLSLKSISDDDHFYFSSIFTRWASRRLYGHRVVLRTALSIKSRKFLFNFPLQLTSYWNNGKNPCIISGGYMGKVVKIIFLILLALFILAYIFRQLSWN